MGGGNMATNYGKLDFAVAFNRQTAYPLDGNAYFESKATADAAIENAKAAGSSSSQYYYGQLITVYENGVAKVYQIQKQDDKKAVLAEIGGKVDLSSYVDLTSAQTISGNKTFTGNVITSNNKFEIKATGNTDDSWIKLTNASDDGYYAFGIRRPYNTYGLQLKIKAAGKPESEAEYYDIWNAHNDGSGSGLDADKLDGQEGSYYLNYNNFTNKPTIPAAQIQSDWNQTDTSKADYIKNKPTIPTVPTDYIGGNGKSGYLAVFDAYDSITDSAVTHNSGVLDALGYKMSSKATWQYNSSTDCVELVW